MFGIGKLFRGGSSRRIDPATVARLVREGALLLDVRTRVEFAMGAPSGALNIPVQELPARLGELPRDRTIVAYCLAGVRSANAVEQLVAAGFDARDAGGVGNVM
jgi:rhodanese-related sulfurtransferase